MHLYLRVHSFNEFVKPPDIAIVQLTKELIEDWLQKLEITAELQNVHSDLNSMSFNSWDVGYYEISGGVYANELQDQLLEISCGYLAGSELRESELSCQAAPVNLKQVISDGDCLGFECSLREDGTTCFTPSLNRGQLKELLEEVED